MIGADVLVTHTRFKHRSHRTAEARVHGPKKYLPGVPGRLVAEGGVEVVVLENPLQVRGA